MRYNQHFPVAIALTKSHGWQAIYEESQCKGVTFDTVFWLRQPAEELGLMIETCLRPNSDCIQMQNLLVPGIFRMLKKIDLGFDFTKIDLSLCKENEE